MGKKKDKKSKDKKDKVKRKSPLKGSAYKIEGNKAKTQKSACPKCGEGVFLAEHKDRQHCGKCGYSRWKKE